MGREHVAMAAITLAISSPAAAWTLLGLDWSWQSGPMSDPFYINHSSFPASVGSQTDVQDALERALATWGDEGDAAFRFTYGGPTTTTSWGRGGGHVAQFHSSSVGGKLAIARASGFGDRMQDCDIRFYGANSFGVIQWSADPQGASSTTYDLELVALHEFGHCAGLNHSADPQAVMHDPVSRGTGPTQRHLRADDIDGLQSIYGVAVGVDLNLSVLDPWTAGTTVTVEVSGAPPLQRVHLASSSLGVGDGACYAALGGRCADILAPVHVADSARADATGVALLEWAIPSTYGGLDVGVQAVVLQGPGGADTLMSNAVGGTVLSTASCQGGLVADCDGNCAELIWVGDGICDDGTVHPWGNTNLDCAQFNFDDGDCAP